MDQWKVIRITEGYNLPFIDKIIKDPSIFEDNTNYKLALVYGKAGSFKSSTINIFLKSDSIATGVNSDGVTKGIYLYKKGDLIIADTEGTGTDNSSLVRHDIVSLFCVCSSFIIVNAIHCRFPFKEIADMIDEKLAVLQKMYQTNSSIINKPSLIILCPIGREMKPEKIRLFKEEADKYKRNNIPNEIKLYFSDVVIKVLSPLPEKARSSIIACDKFSVKDLTGSDIIAEVDMVFNIALYQNHHIVPGKFYHLLNEYYKLAKNHQVINPLIFEKYAEFIQEKIDYISNNVTNCDNDYDLYIEKLNELKQSVINQIKHLGIEPVYIDYYINKFEEDFETWSKIHGDVFNEALLSEVEKVYESERIAIIEELKSNSNITYQDFEEMINKSKQRLNQIKMVEKANNDDKKLRISNLIISKVSELESNEFKDVYIELVVCKTTQNKYFNEIKDTLISIKIAEMSDAFAKHAESLNEKLQEAITTHYNTIGQPFEDKSSFTDNCIKNLKTDINEYYESNFRNCHEKCLVKIEESRRYMQKAINNILKKVGTYNPKIIDSFCDESKSVDSKFSEDVGKVLYDIYADEFAKTVIISQYDLISTNATKSCIFSTSYYRCPDCGNIWEIKIEASPNSFLGCGNFSCYGKSIGCNGRAFRTEMKTGNLENKLAEQCDINQVMSICNDQINAMINEAMNQLNQSLVEKH